MLRYFRIFLFGLALVLSMTQVPAATFGQTANHAMMSQLSHSEMGGHESMAADLSMMPANSMTHDMAGMADVILAQDIECTDSSSCVHCATNIACMNHCVAAVAVPSFPVNRLPISLSNQYNLAMLSVEAFFFNQPNTPPPKPISFS